MTLHPYGWPEALVAGPPAWTDATFLDLLRGHPSLQAMLPYLEGAEPTLFDGYRAIHALESSYAARGYGSLLYALVRAIRPVRAVEIGLFQGFSLLSVGAALRDNGAGRITGYDLFDAYPYRHANRDFLLQQVAALGLEPWVTVDAGDAYEIHERWDAVDYLHVDVSNTGDTYRRIFQKWSTKVRQVIVLEGGSAERDHVRWMLDYDKPPIVPAVHELRRAHPEWSFTVLQPFPSVTIACNRKAIGAVEP